MAFIGHSRALSNFTSKIVFEMPSKLVLLSKSVFLGCSRLTLTDWLSNVQSPAVFIPGIYSQEFLDMG